MSFLSRLFGGGGTSVISVDPHTAQELLRQGAKVVDVREGTEYKGGHIPQAKNIPLRQVLSSPEKVPAGPVVMVCASGHRSSMAAKAVAKGGRTDVYNLSGGMSSWNRAKLPVKR